MRSASIARAASRYFSIVLSGTRMLYSPRSPSLSAAIVEISSIAGRTGCFSES